MNINVVLCLMFALIFGEFTFSKKKWWPHLIKCQPSIKNIAMPINMKAARFCVTLCYKSESLHEISYPAQ